MGKKCPPQSRSPSRSRKRSKSKKCIKFEEERKKDRGVHMVAMQSENIKKKASSKEETSLTPFFNFLRCYRKQNCHLSIPDVIRCGARKWGCMTDEEKEPYIKLARRAQKQKKLAKKKKRQC